MWSQNRMSFIKSVKPKQEIGAWVYRSVNICLSSLRLYNADRERDLLNHIKWQYHKHILKLLFFKIYFYLSMCLYVCASTCRSQKRTSDSHLLELELQTVVRCHECRELNPGPLDEQPVFLPH